MPQGFALEEASKLEVITAYGAPQKVVEAVETAPGWEVVGEFYMPKSALVRVDVLGVVSAEGLTLSARLFDLHTNAPVAPSLLTLTSRVPARALSGKFALTGARQYQIQAQCVGAVGDSKFAVVCTATLSD